MTGKNSPSLSSVSKPVETKPRERFKTLEVPIVEPTMVSKGYLNAKHILSDRTESASLFELMEIIPSAFKSVEAVELITAASRPGYSRHVRGFANGGKRIDSIVSVPEYQEEPLLANTVRTTVPIRRNPGLTDGLTIFSTGPLLLRDCSLNKSEANIEAQAALIQISTLFAHALRSRIGAHTLLPNAAMFEAAAVAAEKSVYLKHTNFSLMLADIDHLKQINYLYSYAAGDMVLAAVADRFRNLLAAYGHKGSVIFRPGKTKFISGEPNELEAAANPGFRHDEFAIILQAPLEAAAAIGESLRKEAAIKPVPLEFPLSGMAIISCSFGIVNSSDLTRAGQSLWRRMLDACVYQLKVAREQGGNRVVY